MQPKSSLAAPWELWGGTRGPDLSTRISQSWDAGHLAKARTLDKEALYSPRLSATGLLAWGDQSFPGGVPHL